MKEIKLKWQCIVVKICMNTDVSNRNFPQKNFFLFIVCIICTLIYNYFKQQNVIPIMKITEVLISTIDF